MKISIIGSRSCDGLTVQRIIDNLPLKVSLIISGGADGVDTLAKKVASMTKTPIIEIKPDYKLYGKAAPLIRNKEIVNMSDEVIAFWDYKSNGTRNTILECLKSHKPVKIVLIEPVNFKKINTTQE